MLYSKFAVLCCMFKIYVYSKTMCCIQTCDVFYLYSIICKCVTFAKKCVLPSYTE